MPQFETFRKTQTPFTKEPHVTIQKRGTITLNAAAHALLGSPAAVELLFDRDEQILGLRPVDASADHAVFVRPSSRSPKAPRVISAMAFVRHYDIDTTHARRWVARLDGEVLVIRIDDGQVVSKQRRPQHTDTPDGHRPRPRPAR